MQLITDLKKKPNNKNNIFNLNFFFISVDVFKMKKNNNISIVQHSSYL